MFDQLIYATGVLWWLCMAALVVLVVPQSIREYWDRRRRHD